MRRSFGSSGGSMGGGNGGGMLRSVHRALRAGAGGVGGVPPEPFSPSANSATISTANSRKAKQLNNHQSAPPNTALTLASGGPNNNNNGPPAFSTLINHPKSGASGAAATAAWGSFSGDDDKEWECVDVNDEAERAIVICEDSIFGTAPSTDEVKYAITALQQLFGQSPHAHIVEDAYEDLENEDNRTEGGSEKMISSGCEVDWIEPSMNLENSGVLQRDGSERVYDAFHMLTQPSVQRMVSALSSDNAVWDAVLKNKVVREFRGSIRRGDEEGNNSSDKASDDDGNRVKDILSRFFVNAKAKIMQLVDKITELANEVFQPPNEGGKIENPLQEKLKISLFLSIIVFLIVVVTRAKSV